MRRTNFLLEKIKQPLENNDKISILDAEILSAGQVPKVRHEMKIDYNECFYLKENKNYFVLRLNRNMREYYGY